MRKLLALAAAAALGCGSSSSSSTPVSGTISGKAFTPTETVAIRAGPATCQVTQPGGSTQVDANVSAFAVRLASYSGVCADFADPFCKLHTNAVNVTVLFADLGFLGVTSKLAPGTWNVNPDPTAVQAQLQGSALAGTFVVAYAGAVVTTATCPLGTTAAVAQGILTIKEIGASTITGNVDLTFGTLAGGTFTADGSTLKGDFSASVCPGVVPDAQLCGLAASQATCPTTPTCT